MDRIRAGLRFIIAEFAPLIAFWLLSFAFGTKVAIAGSIAVIVIDSFWRFRKGRTFTRIYLLSSGLTVAFGVIDLFSAQPFMLKYESVVTNLVIGGIFVIGANGEKPLIQESRGGPFPEGADIKRFFQLFTLFWAGYFFAKAGLYFWLARTLPMAQALAVRSIIGSLSLGLMIAISVTQGRRLFELCRKWGLLPHVERPSGRTAQGA